MSSLVAGTEYPLKDGQSIRDIRSGRRQKVMGSIVIKRGCGGQPDTYNDEVCWTLQGNWYRRNDGEEMTGGTSNPVPAREFYLRRRRLGFTVNE